MSTHRQIPANNSADEYTREGTLKNPINHAHDAGNPLSTVEYFRKLLFAANSGGLSEKSHARWPDSYGRDKTGIITVHCLMRIFRQRMRYHSNAAAAGTNYRKILLNTTSATHQPWHLCNTSSSGNPTLTVWLSWLQVKLIISLLL